MNPPRFDRISKLFAERRMSRRQAVATGSAGIAGAALAAAGLAPAAAQDATPETAADNDNDNDNDEIVYLFVQSFHSGSIVPTEGQDGRYTVTLDQGTDQTIYFADRPSRDVGVTPTPRFLQTLGFPEDNPPNAALIVETAPGETDIAVVELFNPTYDLGTQRVTYDVEVLENWQEDLELGFREEPADLATLAPEFGTAHLLIDDCPDGCDTAQVQGIFDCPTDTTVFCIRQDPHSEPHPVALFHPIDSCGNFGVCMPCEPYGHVQPTRCATQEYWDDKCNASFPDKCDGECRSSFSELFSNGSCV